MASNLSRSRRARWLRGCAGLSLVALSFSADAATITLSKFPPNPGLLPGGGWKYTPGSNFGNPPGPRAWVNGVYGGLNKTILTDLAVVSGRAGPLALTATQSIGLGDAAAAVARCLLGGGPVCAAGTAAAAAYAAYRVYGGDGSLTADPGVAPDTTVIDGFWTGNVEETRAPTAAAMCTNAGNVFEGNSVSQGFVWQPAPDGRAICVGIRAGDPYFWYVSYPIIPHQYTNNGCPASIDFSNPIYNVPAGSPIGIDGKCPTARYNHEPITPAQAASRVTDRPPVFPNTDWLNATRDAIDTGGQSVPAGIESSGPASQTGTPTTTTTTSGTTTSTETKTPTYTYNYDGDTITYNTTNNITTVTNNNGTITSTTTTQTGPPAAPQDPTDPCTANPGRVGCQEAGEVSAQPDLYEKKTATFGDALAAFKTQVDSSPLGSATGGFFNVSGGGICPTWTAHIPFIEADVTIDQFCSQFATDALALLKAAFLVVAGIAAFRAAVL